MITEALVAPSPGSPFQYTLINVDSNLRDNEVLVEMKATGVCHTDLNFRNEESLPGLHPAVFGHEGKQSPTKMCCGSMLFINPLQPN